jgi:phosphoribosylformimino-5-aminoimidazole carboxamide ribotide isomerase
MDITQGEVVHAIAGEREKYKPVKSVLTRDPRPLSVAMAFQKLGLEELYIADLDAIRRIGHNYSAIGRIVAETGMKIMVDAGFRRADEVGEYVNEGAEKIVLATETLESFEEIPKVIDIYKTPVVASIDVKFGQIIAGSNSMQLKLEDLIRKFDDWGASEIILLSIDRVGTQRGPDLESLKLALRSTSVPVLVGGGIINIEDIRLLRNLGAAGALVATSLHNAMITKHDIDQM